MPIWFEVTILSLIAYGLGVAAGWTIWNTPPADLYDSDEEHQSRASGDER